MLNVSTMCLLMQEARNKEGDTLDRGDSMDSSDSNVPSTPAVHRRSSLYVTSSEGQLGSLFSSTKEPSIVQSDGSDDAMQKRKSLQQVRETQEISSIRHRSQSIGAFASSVPGASKKAKLQALGLVLDSSANQH